MVNVKVDPSLAFQLIIAFQLFFRNKVRHSYVVPAFFRIEGCRADRIVQEALTALQNQVAVLSVFSAFGNGNRPAIQLKAFRRELKALPWTVLASELWLAPIRHCLVDKVAH